MKKSSVECQRASVLHDSPTEGIAKLQQDMRGFCWALSGRFHDHSYCAAYKHRPNSYR
jgi:hypothetical protein